MRWHGWAWLAVIRVSCNRGRRLLLSRLAALLECSGGLLTLTLHLARHRLINGVRAFYENCIGPVWCGLAPQKQAMVIQVFKGTKSTVVVKHVEQSTCLQLLPDAEVLRRLHVLGCERSVQTRANPVRHLHANRHHRRPCLGVQSQRTAAQHCCGMVHVAAVPGR